MARETREIGEVKGGRESQKEQVVKCPQRGPVGHWCWQWGEGITGERGKDIQSEILAGSQTDRSHSGWEGRNRE